MQKDFIVTVTTEDGTLLIQKKIWHGWSSSLSLLSQLFHILSQVSEGYAVSKTEPGYGTLSSASPSPSPMES